MPIIKLAREGHAQVNSSSLLIRRADFVRLTTAPCCFYVKEEEHGSVGPRFRAPMLSTYERSGAVPARLTYGRRREFRNAIDLTGVSLDSLCRAELNKNRIKKRWRTASARHVVSKKR